MRRVLILCYYFPPTPSAGSVRVRGLVKYLPRSGWQATVITPRRPGRDLTRWPVVETDDADMAVALKRSLGLRPDAALKDLVGGAHSAPGRGLRARLIDAAKAILAVPDTNRGWIQIATRAAAKVLARQDFDALLTTSPPPSAHVAGLRIARRFGLPWLADLRDLWSDDRYSTAPSWRRAIDRRLEIRTFRHAAALVTVSEPLASDLRDLHPGLGVEAIRNGFDPDLVNPGEALTSELTITHTGTLHQGRRDPAPLLAAVRDLVADGTIDRKRVKVRLFTRHEPWLEHLAVEHGLADVVEMPSWVGEEELPRVQRQSQVLLLLHWGGEREEGVYTAKVFEYLAARRPILLVGGTRGVLARLLEETAAGIHVSEREPERLRQILSRYWQEFRTTGAVGWRGDAEQIERHSQLRMAEDFAAVLARISGRRTP